MKRPEPPPLLGVGLVLVLLALVEACSRGGIVNRVLIPPPSVVTIRLAQIVASGAFVAPLARTLLLLVVGYAIATPIGILIGLLMGRVRFIHDLLEPALEMLRPLPKIALLPLLALFVGFGTSLKLTMVVLGVVFPVLINTIQGVRGVEGTLVDMALVFGRSRAGILWSVILPAAMPMILAGMRVGLGFALILVLLAEMLAGTGGLGALIIQTQRTFRVVDMYVWLVLAALLGYGLNAVFVRLEHRLATR